MKATIPLAQLERCGPGAIRTGPVLPRMMRRAGTQVYKSRSEAVGFLGLLSQSDQISFASRPVQHSLRIIIRGRKSTGRNDSTSEPFPGDRIRGDLTKGIHRRCGSRGRRRSCVLLVRSVLYAGTFGQRSKPGMIAK